MGQDSAYQPGAGRMLEGRYCMIIIPPNTRPQTQKSASDACPPAPYLLTIGPLVVKVLSCCQLCSPPTPVSKPSVVDFAPIPTPCHLWPPNFMHILFAVLLLIAGGIVPCRANLGESEAAIEERYGKSFGQIPTSTFGVVNGFIAGGYVVGVKLVDGTSEMEMFSKGDRSEMPASEIIVC